MNLLRSYDRGIAYIREQYFNDMQRESNEYKIFKENESLRYQYDKEQEKRISQEELSEKRISPVIPHHPHPDECEYLLKQKHPTLYNISKIIQDKSDLDIEAVVLLILSATIGACRGRININVDDGYTESATIWSVIAADSGSKKSSVINKIIFPFQEYREKYNAQINITLSEQIIKRKIADQSYKKYEKIKLKTCFESSEASSGDFPFELLNEITSELADIKRKIDNEYSVANEISFLVERTTTKMLGSKLQQNDESLSIISAESGVLNYLCAHANEDLTLWLKSYTQEEYSFINYRKDYTLHNPILSMNILSQVEPLMKFYNKNALNEIGMCVRTLPYVHIKSNSYEFCDNKLGSWSALTGGVFNSYCVFGSDNLSSVSTAPSIDVYNQKIISLLELYSVHHANQPIMPIKFSLDAKSFLEDFRQKMNGKSATVASDAKPWYSKAHGHAARLACAIHVWYNEIPHNSEITYDEVELACALTSLISLHIDFIYGDLGIRSYINAPKIIKSLFNLNEVPRLEVMRNGYDSTSIQQRTGLKSSEANNALRLLEGHNQLVIYDDGTKNYKFMLHRDFYRQRCSC